MTDDVDRKRLLQLLETLGAEDDAEVLAAARQIDALVGESGLSWADLLDTGADIPEPEEDEEDAAAAETGGMDAAATAVDANEENAQSLRLIEAMLAKSDLSEAMRQELAGYKDDIAEGEFEDMDRKYVRSLHARLTKRG